MKHMENVQLSSYTLCIYFVHVCIHATTCMWKSEDNWMELVLFHHVGSGNRTQFVRHGDKHFYTLCHLC